MPISLRKKVQLLHGPYLPPSLRRGNRATCLYRDAEVVITGWSDRRIAWPRCQRPKSQGGSGLLVDEELARAIRHESALALRYWFGVSEKVVWQWRKALGVEPLNEGSAWLRKLLNAKIADRLRGKRLSPEQVERRRRTALELGLRPTGRWKGRTWTKKELSLLGKAPDAEVAARIGRTEKAVRSKRAVFGIQTAHDRRRRQDLGTSRRFAKVGSPKTRLVCIFRCF